MIYTLKQKIGAKDLEKCNYLGNRAVIEYLENAACFHADSLGYGINSMDRLHAAWILLEWRVKVHKRPRYGDGLTINTWSRWIERCYAARDFELFNENGELMISATSKWLWVDTEKWSVIRADDEMKSKYGVDPEHFALSEGNIPRLKAPAEYVSETHYTVTRRDIDIFGHMHNLYYLDLAYEALPEDIYEKRLFDGIKISYIKEIRQGEELSLKYSELDGKHTVVISSRSGDITHAVIEFE